MSHVLGYMSRNQRLTLAMTAIFAVVLVTSCGTQTDQDPTGPAPTSPSESTVPTVPTTTSTAPTSSTTAAERGDPLAGRMPLWPFGTVEEVTRWQDGGTGHSPWHLDAEATAIFFTTNYLGFAGVDKVIASDIGRSEAKITVGYQGDLPKPAPAAVLRLVRWGEGENAPWEVVGSIDDTLTLTSPEYGAEITSPVTVGGQITGVDESIDVQVREPGRPTPLGDACCLAAGGENSPWSTTVPITGASNATLTIVAATGGHAADVERFAVTGVRLAG